MSDGSAPVELTSEHAAVLLRESGYRAQVTSDRLVLSATNGLKFGVFTDLDGWIQCRVSLVRRADRALDAASCNAFNQQFRFGKLFIDADGDTTLTADFFIGRDASADVTRAAFAASMDVWDVSVGSLRHFLDQNAAAVATPTDRAAS